MAILFTFERADPRAIVRFVVPPSGRRSLTTIPERLTLGFRAVRGYKYRDFVALGGDSHTSTSASKWCRLS